MSYVKLCFNFPPFAKETTSLQPIHWQKLATTESDELMIHILFSARRKSTQEPQMPMPQLEYPIAGFSYNSLCRCKCTMRHLVTSFLVLLLALCARSAPPNLDNYSHSPNHKRVSVERWPDGWTVITRPGHSFLPVETSAIYLQRFLESTMASIAASMLNNEPICEQFRMTYGALIFDIVPMTTQIDMGWTMMFLLTQYMRNRAARGYTGTGDIFFGHTSGIVFRLSIHLAKGYGVSVLRPCSYNDC